jgi:phosphopentomutase
MARALVIVLDSVGCGHAPDAADYGDAGADTLGHLFARVPGFALPAMAALGLHELLRRGDPGFPFASPPRLPGSGHARMSEASAGKDTTTGHWELAGVVLAQPFATFARFPPELVAELEQAGGTRFLGNRAASGTGIIRELGADHLASGHPILYTSADSVLQIAAHEDPAVFGLDRLQQLCRTARAILDRRGLRVGRVIARPFVGDGPDTFRRTANRHDYSLTPPHTVLDELCAAGVSTLGVGKISDIFAGRGIAESFPTKSNAEGMQLLERLWAARRPEPHLIFANLVDFDMLFGHRRDPAGYARALIEFDRWLGKFLRHLAPGEFLALTADHGNDPFHPGTDHTREQVPLLTLHAPQPPVDSSDFTQLATLLRALFAPNFPCFRSHPETP